MCIHMHAEIHTTIELHGVSRGVHVFIIHTPKLNNTSTTEHQCIVGVVGYNRSFWDSHRHFGDRITLSIDVEAWGE